MIRPNIFSNSTSLFLPLLSISTMALLLFLFQIISIIPIANAFTLHHPSSSRHPPSILCTTTTTISLAAMNKRNGKFNKQKDLAEKMAEARRQRQLDDGGDGGSTSDSAESSSPVQTIMDTLPSKDGEQQMVASSAEEIKLRNDRQRFADLLENSMTNGGGGGDLEKGFYLTLEQENESADAVFRGVARLYEGDPAPTSPFAELLNIENGEPIGKGGMKRLLPWEGSRSSASADYLVVITDPRPKSAELRTAMKRLSDALSSDALGKCVVINADTPAENRRFVKKNLEEASPLRIMCDENLEWMREYTALGETRFSMTVFVLRDGRVEKIAREVEAEVLAMVVKNAIRSLN